MTDFVVETTLEQMKNDYNWNCAFYQAEHGTYGNHSETLMNLTKVIASSDGENDSLDWIALFIDKKGRYGKIFAGCDYTGWDCVASGNIEYYDSLEELLSKNTLTEQEAERLGVPWE